MASLITDYQFELADDPHARGNLNFAIVVTFPVDISAAMPYLNASLQDTVYDHANAILIGTSGKVRYAFRRHEIRLGLEGEPSHAKSMAANAVALVNRSWDERDCITPSTRERKSPATFDIFRSLPRTNCKKCGCNTCLAFAEELRTGRKSVLLCPSLAGKSADRIVSLLQGAP
jgi:ArsR family metal-binding transcriptional regulator